MDRMDRMGWDGMGWDGMGWIDIFLWPYFAMVKLHEMNVINGGAWIDIDDHLPLWANLIRFAPVVQNQKDFQQDLD